MKGKGLKREKRKLHRERKICIEKKQYLILEVISFINLSRSVFRIQSKIYDGAFL